MKVATWNINNVVKRLPLLLAWLARSKPDVVALQELKTPTAAFPAQALKDAGYASAVVGQRTWNGVALICRGPDPLVVTRALPGDASDKEARYIEAAIDGVLFAGLYLPNGNPQPGPKFSYKVQWFERLRQRTQELWASGQPVVLLGDWNVVPTDADIYKPDTWRDNALLQPEPRQAFAEILAQGWTDALKTAHPADTPFTFWDYRRQRWQRNAGLRIDHILVGAALSVSDAGVDREERGQDEASDHAPVWAEIALKTSQAGQPIRTGGAADGPLSRYNAKRNFKKTAEPAGTVVRREAQGDEPLQFVVQKHWASRLHYDFRLELDGVMLSWAVPKGPSFDPSQQQMAIRVEDHPLAYNAFEGSIPKGQYGAGSVIVWDQGTWQPVVDAHDGLAAGKLIFTLHGQKLAGLWELVRISKPGTKKQDQWLLFKKRGDAWVRPASEYDVTTALPDSVLVKPLGLIEERQRKAVAGTSIERTPDLSKARQAALPKTLAPQLATLASNPPAGDGWIVENKFDGYRLLARIEHGAVQLFTRAGNDWTHKFKPLARAIAALPIDTAWLDGEIVVLGPQGTPDFNRLQNAIDSAHGDAIQYFVFDVPFLGGMDYRDVPLAGRRAVLKDLLAAHGGDQLRISDTFDASPAQMLEAARRIGLEGVIAKRADAPYVCRRSDTWLKLKCQQRQEFVVVGFTDRANAKGDVGSLLLGYHENGSLRSAGSVGTGWNAAEAADLHRRVSKLLSDRPTVDATSVVPGRWSRRTAGSERWVRPEMVVEVAFGDWTPDGHIRHAVWKGIRTDKPVSGITREAALPRTAAAETTSAAPRAIKITNPDRVIDPSTGFKKVNLVRYYESIADWLLPHLKGRPVSLVRAPDGITGELFFQKHLEMRMPGMLELDPGLWPGHTALLGVDGAEALVAAAQMNVVEFHTWNSTTERIDQPDRMIFDLDPGEGVSWPQLQEAALLMRTLLSELGLESWLKTSGGKGLHVVVPLAPKLNYDDVKGLSQAAVQHMARTIPQRFVAKAGGANRVGKIFIDYLRNGHAQTTASAFTARARPGMGVSMPVGWDDLASLKGGAQWGIATARDHVSLWQQDPWQGYWKSKQSLTRAVKALGYVLKARDP